MELFEILIPKLFNSGASTLNTRAEFERVLVARCKGFTRCAPVDGAWVDPKTGHLFTDTSIPYRVACDENTARELARLAARVFRQEAVMVYRVADKVSFETAPLRATEETTP